MTINRNKGSDAIFEEIWISEVELNITKVPKYARIGSSAKAWKKKIPLNQIKALNTRILSIQPITKTSRPISKLPNARMIE